MFENIDQVWLEFFFRKKLHHLLGETVGDSCSVGPGSKQCTGGDGLERVYVQIVWVCVATLSDTDACVLCWQLEKGFEEGLNNAMELYGKKGEEEITAAFDELQQKVGGLRTEWLVCWLVV